MVERLCDEKKCCTATFCPLQLAFARTLHTFQGQSAGITVRPPHNPVRIIIVDPGDRAFEGNNPGLLYMSISRATTIGNGDPYKSALYFTGNNMNMSRIMNLTRKTNGDKFVKVKLREKWINRLDTNTITPPLSNEQVSKTLHWANTYKMNESLLAEALCNWEWRHNMHVDVNY